MVGRATAVFTDRLDWADPVLAPMRRSLIGSYTAIHDDDSTVLELQKLTSTQGSRSSERRQCERFRLECLRDAERSAAV